MMNKLRRFYKARVILPPMVLVALVWALYWQSASFGFVELDDKALLLSMPIVRSFTWENLRTLFTHFSISSYYPVRTLSFVLDRFLWGVGPMGLHLGNVFLHTSNVLLLYALILRMAPRRVNSKDPRPAAFLSAAFFGLHPVCVDTVAWIAGREELLTLFFSLGAMHFHLWSMAERKKLVPGVLVAGSVLLACLSNVQAAVLPGLLCAYMIIVLGQRRLVRILLSTWHLWLIAGLTVLLKLISMGLFNPQSQAFVFSYVPEALAKGAYLIKQARIHESMGLDLADRIRIVISLYGANFFHLAVPLRLPVLYKPQLPPSFFSLSMWQGYLAAGATAAGIWAGRRNRLFIFSVVWFLIALFPSSQIIAHHVWRADRFLYAPAAGLSVALFAAVRVLGARLKPSVTMAAVGGYVALLAVAAFLHVGVWRDGFTLHKYTTASNPDYYLAHQYRAIFYRSMGRYGEAADHYLKAMATAPDNNTLRMQALNTLMDAGLEAKALAIAKKAIEDNPDDVERYNVLGMVLTRRKEYSQAAQCLEKALKKRPDNEVLRHNLASVYYKAGRYAKALEMLNKALELNPRSAKSYYLAGLVLESQGKWREAARQYALALEWAPAMKGPRQRLEALYLKANHK